MMPDVLYRHRRLLALCAGSACVHFAVLAWIAAKPSARPDTRRGETDVLRLRLTQPAASPVSVPAPSKTAAADPPAPQPVFAPQTGVEKNAPSDAPQAAPSVPPADAAPADVPVVDNAGTFRVRMPEGRLMSYSVMVVEHAGAAPKPAPDARLDLRSDGSRYRLTLDGVLGRFESEGGMGDNGIVPRRASEQRGDTSLRAEFDDAAGLVRFEGRNDELRFGMGMQDRASMLMQLAGIGIADPDQFNEEVEVAVTVADAGQARLVRLKVIGPERLSTGIGSVDAIHLAEIAPPGMPRMDIWLGPAHGWMPVQLRVSGPDGSIATQTLSALAAGGALDATD